MRVNWKRKRIPLLFGLIVTLACLWLEFSHVPIVKETKSRLENLAYDVRYTLTLKPAKASAHKIIVVDIDEASLAVQGRWPWTRHKIAKMIERIAEYGAVVLAMDMVFAEPEQNPVAVLRSQIPESEHLLQWDALYDKIDADRHLASVWPGLDAILGYVFHKTTNIKLGRLPQPVLTLQPGQAKRLVIPVLTGYSANLPMHQEAALTAGFVSTFPDIDGVIRRSPVLLQHENRLYTSLGFAAAQAYLFEEQVEIVTEKLGNIESVTHVKLGARMVPTDATARVLVPFRGQAKSFPYISATDVIEGKARATDFENAIVFVGTSAYGLSDTKTTPVGTGYPGVEVHANIAQALIDGKFPFRPDWQAGAVFLMLCMLGVGLSVVLPLLRPSRLFLVSILVFAAVIFVNFYLWSEQYLDLPIAIALIQILLLMIGNLGHGFWRENARRHQVKAMFGQYVPAEHVEEMVEAVSGETFGSRAKNLTVMFADIRSFTSISEGMSAEELTQLLNEYFTPITENIFDHKGTIDKYVGDMVMAFWGAPIDDEKHREHAIDAAFAMLETTERLAIEFELKGWPDIQIGIGLNSGTMNVGDMGSEFRRAYTVLGDAVNLGSRVESLTKYYGVKLMVGEGTLIENDAYLFRQIDKILVKGKEKPVGVYEPICKVTEATAHITQLLALHQIGLQRYFEQAWGEAEKIFNALIEHQLPFSKTIYEILLGRMAMLKLKDLPEDWDGVFRHTEK